MVLAVRKVVLLMTITLHRSLLVVDPSKTFSDKLTTTDINSIENELLYQAEVKAVTKESVPPSFNVYFPNDNAQIPYNYENGFITSTQHINYEVYDAGYGIGPTQVSLLKELLETGMITTIMVLMLVLQNMAVI
jgi:hypothetical protein